MKKIKKIAAGLMAAAIAAAGMGSLTASAVYGTQYRTLYWTNYTKAEAACEYNTGSWYCVSLRFKNNTSIYNRRIQLWADLKNGGTVVWPDQRSETTDLFFTAYPNGSQNVKYFKSYCTAYYAGQQRLAAFCI